MARGLSQEEVARRTGIGLKSYGDLERGRTKDPHYSTLRGVARALEVRVEDLLEEPALAGTPGKAEDPTPPSGPKAVTGSARIPLPPEQFAILAALAASEISVEEAAERLARIREAELATA